MKHWQEHYLVKHKRKHFGRINIGDYDKIISDMRLNLQLGVKINVPCCTINTFSLSMVAQVVQ